MDTKDVTEANREAWEEAAPRHAAQNQKNLVTSFRDPAFSLLEDIEVVRLKAIGIEGKDVAQVCCNNGRELICVKRMGAARCVGFDGAQGFVDQARELAEAAQADCEFVCTNIYDMDPAHQGCFDVVVITIGVISWMPDLQAFFDILGNLLRPGGVLFIHEHHPILEMMKPGDPDDPVEFELSYFDKNPYVETGGLDYYSGETYDAKPATSFLHTMAEVIMAGLQTGMAVEHFEERPQHISNTWWNVEKQIDGFPMSYTLILRKQG
ncbi:MAG: class I SAM-dependent methyltransferase [Rhodospirillales bacterium]|nr:class I SAM-dependent methyltransferase [Rhodospirillales bacterium]